jgi:hypothetical protein
MAIEALGLVAVLGAVDGEGDTAAGTLLGAAEPPPQALTIKDITAAALRTDNDFFTGITFVL